MSTDGQTIRPPSRSRRTTPRLLAQVSALLALLLSLAGLVTPPVSAATGTPCTGGSLYVAAHEDDDLIFMSPDLLHDLAAERCVRTVFVTAGDAGLGEDYWRSRELGPLAAYADMVGSPNSWTSQTVEFAGVPVTVRTLAGNSRISLVYLRLPDGMDGGGAAANDFDSLHRLMTGDVASIRTVDGATSYTLNGLSATIGQLIETSAPENIRTHNFDDDGIDDHAAVAELIHSVSLRQARPHNIFGYLDYGVSALPENVTGTDLESKRAAFVAYAATDPEVCLTTCPDPAIDEWLKRQVIASSESRIVASAVTFTDPFGSAGDTYSIPTSSGVEYLVGTTVVPSGTYPASGTVTVTARAATAATLSGTTSWNHTFTSDAVPAADTAAAVYRWWSAAERDWVGIADDPSQPSAAEMIADGYARTTTPQFYAYLGDSPSEDRIAVHRWWQESDGDWVDIPSGSLTDATLTSYGYRDKTLQYYLHATSATGRVAVNRWWSGSDRDWITLRQGEIADSTLLAWGYTGKALLGYAQASMPATPSAHLTLVKMVVNTAGTPAAATNWTLTASGPTPLTGAGGVPRTPVLTGTYTLSETGTVAGYTNGTTWACATPTGTPVTVTNSRVEVTTGSDIACTITNTGVGALVVPGSAAPTPVQRWWSATQRDWVAVPQHGSLPTSPELAAYTRSSTPRYYVSMIGSTADDEVAVYRWWSASDRDWVDIPDGSIPDSRLEGYGYSDKTFQYFAHDAPASGRVAIYRWWSAADRDWISLGQGEIADSTLIGWGYTSKTLVAYAVEAKGSAVGYFALGTPQSSVVRESYSEGEYPHTMSVLDVNPTLDPAINKGYRYLGYFGHNMCGGVYIARSNDLDAARWVQDPNEPDFPTTDPCRWAATALVDGNRIALVVNEVWDETITLQMSTDGLNGQVFGPPTVLVSEVSASNGNPILFRDPTTNLFHLYWYRFNDGQYEIRVKSSATIAGLLGGGRYDIGTLVARADEIMAAPSVMYVNGLYYLAVETSEGLIWRTRVLTGTAPTGPFHEIPGNPVYVAGAACVFQHVVGNSLHSFYCMKNDPNSDDSWSLDHVRGNLLAPN